MWFLLPVPYNVFLPVPWSTLFITSRDFTGFHGTKHPNPKYDLRSTKYEVQFRLLTIPCHERSERSSEEETKELIIQTFSHANIQATKPCSEPVPSEAKELLPNSDFLLFTFAFCLLITNNWSPIPAPSRVEVTDQLCEKMREKSIKFLIL